MQKSILRNITKVAMMLLVLITFVTMTNTSNEVHVEAKKHHIVKKVVRKPRHKKVVKIKKPKTTKTNNKIQYIPRNNNDNTSHQSTKDNAATSTDTNPQTTPAASNWKATNDQLPAQIPWETSDITQQDLTTQTFGDDHTVYYRVNPNAQQYTDQINAAAQNWNNLNTITFKPTTDPNQTAIDISYGDDNDENQRENSLAETKYSFAGSTIMNQHVYIEAAQFDNKNNNVKVNVLTHELGHALGFAHDYTHVSNPDYPNDLTKADFPTMTSETPNNGDSDIIPIGNREAAAIHSHYNF